MGEKPDSSRMAYIFGSVRRLVIWTAVVSGILQALRIKPWVGTVAVWLDTAIDAIFLVEVFARFIICPGHCAFVQNPFNIIDLLSGTPIFLRATHSFELPTDEGLCT